MQRYLAWAAVAVAVAGLTAQYIMARWPQNGADTFAECRKSKIAQTGQKIGSADFSVQDGQGKIWTREEIFAQPSLIYFGYTFCPDVCPFDTVRNAEAADILAQRGMDVRPVFITVDPARDTPQVMQEYASNMHPAMLGLSGTEESLKEARKSFFAVASIPPNQDEEYYVVDHTTFSYLTVPEHGFVEFFRREVTAEQMADQLACFLEKT